MPLRLRTNAKVNLFLEVREKLPNGFHSIETIFQSVSLADELEFEMNEALRVEMKKGAAHGDLPATESNLVTRAALALAGAAGIEARGRVHIEKNIPLAAGLAGGSANAAGALLALQEIWGTDAELETLAAGLGADVPFCLRGGTARATGKGEVLTSMDTPTLSFVLGIDDQPLSTGDVYSAWRPGDRGRVPVSEMADALRSKDPERIGAAFRNDLEFPAFRLRPELLEKKQSLFDTGALGALLSGSGPTVLGLARDETHAGLIAERCRGNFHRVEVVSSAVTCVEREGPDS